MALLDLFRKSIKKTALAAGIAAALASSSCSLHSLHETEKELKLGKPAVVLLKKQEGALNGALNLIGFATTLLKFAETYRSTGELAQKVGKELESVERLQDALRMFTLEQDTLDDAQIQLEKIELENVCDELEKLKASLETSGKDLSELQHALNELNKAIAEKKILMTNISSARKTGQFRIIELRNRLK